MAKKKNEIPDITIKGDIKVNGPMFDIHDNKKVEITYSGKVSQKPDDDFEYVNLVFLDKKLFGTYDRQLALHKLLKEAFKRMSLDTGRDLVAVYIAFHFIMDQLLNIKKYTDFLQDIEGLMPKVLPNIKEEEETRSLRYKSYAESLALECEKWFIENECLPDKKMWKSLDYKYGVDDNRRNRIQKLVTDIYQGMINITA
ncbi:MAG: hypothetical protein IKD75_07665 [Prevotella sp.]|nr:hypothetical protein [Prevotella sp.]